jgi:hypothetical protein
VLALASAPILLADACAEPKREPVRPSTTTSLPAAAISSSAPTLTVASPSASTTTCRELPYVDLPPVLGSVGVPTSALVPSIPADAPKALASTCRRLAATYDRNVRTLPTYKKPGFWSESSHDTEGRCFAGPRGAWLLELSTFRPERLGTFSFSRGTWSLVFVTSEGKERRGPEARGTLDVAVGEADGTVGVLALNDFDGDGVPEVLLELTTYTAIDGGRATTASFTLRGDSVVPWASPMRSLAWFDVDRDGRVDVLGESPLAIHDLPAFAHALGNGGFSTDDDVARGLALRACPTIPPDNVRGRHDLACALLWGSSPEAARDRIPRQRVDESCAADLDALTRRWKVPPLLSGACPVPSLSVALPPTPGPMMMLGPAPPCP